LQFFSFCVRSSGVSPKFASVFVKKSQCLHSRKRTADASLKWPRLNLPPFMFCRSGRSLAGGTGAAVKPGDPKAKSLAGAAGAGAQAAEQDKSSSAARIAALLAENKALKAKVASLQQSQRAAAGGAPVSVLQAASESKEAKLPAITWELLHSVGIKVDGKRRRGSNFNRAHQFPCS
jgi:hypothetical protein